MPSHLPHTLQDSFSASAASTGNGEVLSAGVTASRSKALSLRFRQRAMALGVRLAEIIKEASASTAALVTLCSIPASGLVEGDHKSSATFTRMRHGVATLGFGL
jgi:hypothetical protein